MQWRQLKTPGSQRPEGWEMEQLQYSVQEGSLVWGWKSVEFAWEEMENF